jgi:6-phosphofructokinase 2
MKSVATLTLNPTIDICYSVETLAHTHKLRAEPERADPGGGGINVARVLARLGCPARCVYLSGGATGPAFDGLIEGLGLPRERIAIAGQTRVVANVFERSSGKEYRIIPPGPELTTEEWGRCLEALADLPCDYLVLSGSLPTGVPDHFYAQVAAAARKRGSKVVLDSSGAGLKEGLAGGDVCLVKPSSGELSALCGRELDSDEEIEREAAAIVARGEAEAVAVTMGHRGALLVSSEGTLRLPPIEVEVKSAVGAGDSFLAAMVFALAEGQALAEAFRWGLAAGTAAVETPGSDLAQPEDIARLRALVAG